MPDWVQNVGGRKFGIGLATGLAALVVLLALANTELTYTPGNFHLEMSLLPRTETDSAVSQDPLAAPVTQQEFAMWQQRSLELIRDIALATEEQRRRELSLALTQFARNVDIQRYRDLGLVEKGLVAVEQSSEGRFRQTDQSLQRLITLVQSQAAPPNRFYNE